MATTEPLRIKSITEAHRLFKLPRPAHPLINVMKYADVQAPASESVEVRVILEFYYISLKRGFKNKLYYGQQTYDFDEGMLYFVAPNQILGGAGASPDDDLSGWVLMIHPDFLWGTSLAGKLRKYAYFDYAVHEALFLSEREEAILNAIVQNIEQECRANTDAFSQDIIVSHLETLLNYAERFYQRQFLHRKITNHQLLDRLDRLLTDYFASEELIDRGLPSVQYVSDSLNVSPSYLRGMLKSLTGQSTQQHIHDKLIERAKEKLSTTSLSVSEIAYALGFEHVQSFSKLFKAKTKVSPGEFRQSFN